MDVPHLGSKSKYIPPHLVNGNTNTRTGNSPLRTSVSVKEREKLTASILSSNSRVQALDPDPTQETQINGHRIRSSERPRQIIGSPSDPPGLEVAARDPRDEPSQQSSPIASRPESPYTLNPPIDFDGLSWPSEL